MQENVYAVPESILNDSQVVPVRQMFYVVSKTKFLVLFFCTFGMYSLYWHFKNWKQYKDYHKDRIIPALRAIFSIFFTHSLFSEVDGVLKRSEKKFDWDPTSCASWVVVSAILGNVIDRIAESTGVTWLVLIVFPLLAVHGLLLLRAQTAINISCDDPLGITNNKFTGLNWFWIVIGFLFVAIMLFGIFLIFIEA